MASSIETSAFQFRCPFNAIVVGSSQSGKTSWTLELLKHPELFDVPVHEVLWFHGVHAVNLPNSAHIKTISGLPDVETLKHVSGDGKLHRLVVIDDLLVEAMANKELIAEIWTRVSHHCNMSFLLLSQSLFEISRLVRNNSHYVVMFKALADRLNVVNFGRQLFPGELQFFLSSFNNATQRQYGYIIISAHPREDRAHFRLCTDIFGVHKVYLPAKPSKT